MIVILRREDLPRRNSTVPVDKIRPYHLGVDTETLNKAELVVFLENSKVNVIRATDWPFGKPMSAAELYRYLAGHAVNENKPPNL